MVRIHEPLDTLRLANARAVNRGYGRDDFNVARTVWCNSYVVPTITTTDATVSLWALFASSFLAATLLPGGSEVVLAGVLQVHPRQYWLALAIATRNALICAPTAIETLKDDLHAPPQA